MRGSNRIRQAIHCYQLDKEDTSLFPSADVVLGLKKVAKRPKIV
jgi:hypothetical protein